MNRTADHEMTAFRDKLTKICRKWMLEGLPSRQALDHTATELIRWKEAHLVKGLRPRPRSMVTATLDDGLGQGIQIIEQYARIAGIQIHSMGLLQQPDVIVQQCRRLKPDLLGLTILQLDSDEDLCRVGHNLPSQTRLIAGGPVFTFDPDMALRCKVDYVAADLSYFMDYLLKWPCP